MPRGLWELGWGIAGGSTSFSCTGTSRAAWLPRRDGPPRPSREYWGGGARQCLPAPSPLVCPSISPWCLQGPLVLPEQAVGGPQQALSPMSSRSSLSHPSHPTRSRLSIHRLSVHSICAPSMSHPSPSVPVPHPCPICPTPPIHAPCPSLSPVLSCAFISFLPQGIKGERGYVGPPGEKGELVSPMGPCSRSRGVGGSPRCPPRCGHWG